MSQPPQETESHATGSTPARRRRVHPIVAVVVLLGAAGVLAWRLWPAPAPKLPSPTGDHVVIAKFVGSPEFARLPMKQQEEYLRPLMNNMGEMLEAVRTGKLTMEDAKRGMTNAGMLAMSMRADDYFALPSNQRTAFLDKLIDERERAKPFLMSWRQDSSNNPMASMRQAMLNPSLMKKQIESTDPMTRVKIAEFMGAIHDRRKERGLPDPMPH